MKLLLTGATGYLGSAVAQELQRRELPWEPLTTRLHEIRAKSLDCTHVIHCAGARRDRANDIGSSNAHGTQQLLAGLTAPARIIFASSRSVYAPSCSDRALTENAPLGPQDEYGVSKLDAEASLRKSTHDFVICRLTTLYGASPMGSCPSFPNQAWRAFEQGLAVNVVSQDCTVDYLWVARAAKTLVACALHQRLPSAVLNVADTPRSLHAFMMNLAKRWQPTARLRFDLPARPRMACLDTRRLQALQLDFGAAREQSPDQSPDQSPVQSRFAKPVSSV